MISQKKKMYFLMALLIILWGLDYVFAKKALEIFDSLTLLFVKYFIGFIVVLVIKLKMDGKTLIRKKDVPLFLLCTITGEIGYFFFEYTAMDYLPISLITIILAFVPALSILIDWAVFKKRPTKIITAGIVISILGVALVIGVDYDLLFQGRIIGYLLAVGAVITWNIYNFITASLHERYESSTLTLNQILCTILLTFPYAAAHMPAPSDLSFSVILGLLYLGVVCTGICFVIQVRALHVLGPTVTAVYTNFLPITATFFGWLILKETLSPLQLLGGAVVIAAGYIVIKEKGKMEEMDS